MLERESDAVDLLDKLGAFLRRDVRGRVETLEPHADPAPYFAMLLGDGRLHGLDLADHFETQEGAEEFLTMTGPAIIRDFMPDVVAVVHTAWASRIPGARASQAPDRSEAVRVAVISPFCLQEYVAELRRRPGMGPELGLWASHEGLGTSAFPTLHQAICAIHSPFGDGRVQQPRASSNSGR